MSTAARPTFHAAQGRTTYGGSYTMAVSAKDQAAHTKLKFRKFGQASVDEMTTKDLKSNLEEINK
jgi:protein CWC15